MYSEDGLVSEVIKKNGGIPFTKTNLPQMVAMPETLNRVFGVTKNPHNPDRCAGGSSGGEGALLGSRSSPIGIGTDAAGSIRIPCSFCGVYGFKPSYNRMTRRGVQENCDWQFSEGKEEIIGITGPMGHSIDDLVQIMRIFFSDDVFCKDISVLPTHFNNETYQEYQNPKKIRLGYFMHDGLFYPVKTVRRAIEATVEKCKAAGVEMVPLDITKLDGLIEGFGKLMLGGTKLPEQYLDGEPPIIEDDPTAYIEMIPDCIKKVMVFVLSKIGMRRECVFLK